MKPKRKGPPTIDIADWDFSKIPESEAVPALNYELARSSPRAIEDLNEILCERVGDSTVREQVLAGAHYEELVKRCGHFMFAYSVPIFSFALRHPFFPKPWMNAEATLRRRIVRNLQPKAGDISFRSIRDETGDAELRRYSLNDPEWAHCIIDFDLTSSASVKHLCAKFAEWIRTTRKAGPKRGRGSENATPIPDLRALAAWRMQEAGLSQESAEAVIQGAQKGRSLSQPDKVWPLIRDTREWMRARARAKVLIKNWEARYKPSKGWGSGENCVPQ